MNPKERRRRWIGGLLFGGFLLAVALLLGAQIRDMDWVAVADALLETPVETLLFALLLALCSYLAYASMDLISQRYVGHGLARPRVLTIGAISYAFNLNICALVGSAGFRIRLYSKAGLSGSDIARIITLSILGNWSGYVLLSGIMLTFRPSLLPLPWSSGQLGMQLIGGLLLLMALAYPALCSFWPSRRWSIRGHIVELPSLHIALRQILLSTSNWLLITVILWLLLRPVAFESVLWAVLLAAVAGAIAHIPAGLGVMEAVFLLLLPETIGQHRILAALMAYRGIYYLLPLAIAVLLYSSLERMAATRRGANPPEQ